MKLQLLKKSKTNVERQNPFRTLAFLLVIASTNLTSAQWLPECDSVVPMFTVDLSTNPNATYITPTTTRVGSCCSAANPINFISFYATLHPNAAMVEIGIAEGADPYGSGEYHFIDGGDLITPGVCLPNIPAGQPVCIPSSLTGPTYKIAFGKPGNNANKFFFKQILKPTFPEDDSTRVGCSLPLNIYGLENINITSINSSTGQTTPGYYDNLLSCSSCSSPSFSPGLTTPDWIDFQICGTQEADLSCGVYATCDTVRIYTFDALEVNVSPQPAVFCAGDSVTIEANASGGVGPYTYTWYKDLSILVSTDSLYTANEQADFDVYVADQLVSSSCPVIGTSVIVDESDLPIVNAGIDDTICATSPDIFLAGNVLNAEGGTWSAIGGGSNFNPSADSLLTVYTPTSADINNGFVDLVLTSTGSGGCASDSDTVRFVFSDTVFVNPTYAPVTCYGDMTTINANATGGTGGYDYFWSTGSIASAITVSGGTYTVTAEDDYGCSATAPVTVVDPAPIILIMSSTNTSTDLACDGTATVAITGGVGPYTVVWDDPGTQTTLTATGLCWGAYTATVTDANGCTVSSSVVVNKPSCLAFQVTADSTLLTCYGDNDATATSSVSGGTGPYSYSWNTIPVQTTPTATGLGAGTYTVTVTDANGCIDVAGTSIIQPQVMTNTMTHIDASSIGGNEGSATANPGGGVPGYTYSWFPAPAAPQTTQTASNLTAGVYFVNITDNNGCVYLDSVQINEPPCNDFQIGVNTNDVSCYGNSDGSAYIVIAQGTAPFFVSWSTGQSGFGLTSISGLAAGSYSVSVTDASNCTTFESFDIVEPDSLTIGLVPTNVTCYNESDGTIDLNVVGGTFPYSFEWVIGVLPYSTSQDLVGLKPGTYSVVVSDANKCTAIGSIGITQPLPLETDYSYADVLCNGDGNGSIDVTISGGQVPYSYSWTGPNSYTSTSEDISGLEIGLYELQITDGNGCNLNSLMQAYISQPDSVKIEAYSVPCPAPGANDVAVSIDTITGGAGEPYQVSFDGGSTWQTAGDYNATLGLGATYDLMAMDSNSCDVGFATTITIDPKVEITAVTFDPCIAVGTSNIDVTVTPTGGDGGPYEVSTDGGSTWNAAGSYIISVPVDNNYNVVIRDGKGCESVVWPITVPAPFDATVTFTSEVSCPGESDGSLNLTITGGTSPYTYSWTGPGGFTSSSEDLTGLEAGTYDVVVTDDSSCVATESIVITTTPDVTPPFMMTCGQGAQNVDTDPGSCTYTNTGTAWDATASDNCLLASLTYTLTGATTGTGTSLNGVAFNLGTTLVTWTAVDGSGNTASCSFNVIVSDDEFPVISSCGGVGTQNVNTDPAQCTYANTGTGWDATVIENCTVASLTYTLSGATSGTGTTLDGVTFAQGTTTVVWTVVDGSGNTATCSFDVVVSDNEVPIISNCGSNVNVNNDVGDCGAIVNWTPPTYTDNCGATMTASHNPGDFFPIGTTTVTYTVTDAAGNVSVCSFNVTVTDSELPQMTCASNYESCDSLVYYVTPTATDNCGVVSVTMTSGQASGTFFPVGTTTVTYEAVDVNGNVNTCSFDVTIRPTPVLSSVSTDVTCFSFGDGSVDLTVTNGTAPFNYNWSNGATTQDISSLGEGIYNVTVTDVFGCSASLSDTVNEPDALSITKFVTHVSCNGFGDGDIDITVAGGIQPYTYSWSNGETTEDIDSLSGGTYVITVTDANGCTVLNSSTINEPDSILIQTIANEATCNAANGSINAQVTGGISPYIYLWSDGSTNLNLSNVVSGTYTLTVTDKNGCTATATDSIGSNSNLTANVITQDAQCFGSQNGSATIIVESGTGPYTYDWSNGETNSSSNELGAGTYSVIITDAFGCSWGLNFVIDQPNPLVLDMTAYDYGSGYNVSEFGASNGSITTTVSGGTPPYQYAWSPTGDSTSAIFNLTTGTYSLIVEDDNGCVVSGRLDLLGPPSLKMFEGISPDNVDGVNDYFHVKGLEVYPNNHITIYNRWGNVVYELENYDNNDPDRRWYGQNGRGENLPAGTYFVVLEVNGYDGSPLTGYVDLRRDK